MADRVMERYRAKTERTWFLGKRRLRPPSGVWRAAARATGAAKSIKAAAPGFRNRTTAYGDAVFDERTLPLVWLVLMLGAAIIGSAVIAWRERGVSDGGVSPALPPQVRVQTGSPAAPLEEPLPITFPIYLTGEGRIESVTLEQYVRGVVAAEMPIEFELEALKAQAIAARTYIARRFEKQDVSNMPVAGAWVTDSVSHQAYLTDSDILAKWTGPEREANLAKLDRAVRETRNLIMTYEGEPILAVYFSTSNGYTENSEDYWSEHLSYLRSVESAWDREVSPKFRTELRMPLEEFAEKLGIDKRKADQIRVLERTEGRRVKKIRIGGQTFTGREVREKLGLPSTGFAIRTDGGDAVITVTGHGHGVGMSQYGAQGMALAGYKAEDILVHYYSGITIETYRGPDLALLGASGRSDR